ncbi:MAG: permease prefix domain 1-containing protein, partial [Opitutales bacterium]|nr:permease prefix domain 1-containing protein [Opitutales bacterium]
MRKLNQLLNRLRTLIGYSQKQSDLELEIQHHIHHLKEDFISEGYSETEALSMAQKRFGNAENLKEKCRDNWGIQIINDFVRDLVYGLRKFRKQKMGWLLWLMLGICMGGVLLTLWLLELVFWKPLPVEDEDRIAMVWSSYKRTGDLKRGVSISHFVERKDHADSFEEVALTTGHGNI